MSAIAFPPRNEVRLVCGTIVAANVGAIVFHAGWEAVPIHLLLAVAGAAYAVRPSRTIAPRDAMLFGGALTLATIGNELLEGFEPANDVYEAWLLFAILVGLGWLAVRRAQAAAELEQHVLERERMLRRQEQLISDLSHELRTPATIARAHLEPLEAGDGRAAAAAAIALDELARIDRIVERLLLLARAERGRLLELGEVEAEPFLADILLRWSGSARRTWRLGSVPDGSVRADSDALRIAIDALLENAVKYTEPTDSIELRAHEHDGSLVIEVADSGRGIPDDAAEAIFGRAERAGGNADPAGHGLGLAIVDAIARALGGSLALEPSERGSRFCIRLPGYRAEPAADDQFAAATGPFPGDAAAVTGRPGP